MTLYAGGQYFKDSRSFAQEANQFYKAIGSHKNPYTGTLGEVEPFLSDAFGKDGWALNLGLDYPALGGTWKAQRVTWTPNALRQQSKNEALVCVRWLLVRL